MKKSIKVALITVTVGFSALGLHGNALPISLGDAGPNNFAVLETGQNAASANVSIANASNAGYVTGNVGIASSGNLSDSGTPITGNVLASTATSLNPNVAANVSGTITQNSSSTAFLAQAKTDAYNASHAASALTGTSIANITTGGTFSGAPGVYNLSQINLGNTTLTLTGSASDFYIFNISDSITLSHADIVLSGGLNPANVLFNVTRVGGSGVALSGGLATESHLEGIILADFSQVNETPGYITPEIISGDNVSIASGAQVQGQSNVPDAFSTLSLMILSLGMLGLAKFKLVRAA